MPKSIATSKKSKRKKKKWIIFTCLGVIVISTALTLGLYFGLRNNPLKANYITFNINRDDLGHWKAQDHSLPMKGNNYPDGKWKKKVKVSDPTNHDYLNDVGSQIFTSTLLSAFVLSQEPELFVNVGGWMKYYYDHQEYYLELDLQLVLLVGDTSITSTMKSIKPAPICWCGHNIDDDKDIISFGSDDPSKFYFITTDGMVAHSRLPLDTFSMNHTTLVLGNYPA